MNKQKKSLRWHMFDLLAFAVMMLMSLFLLLIMVQYVMYDCTILEATEAIIKNKRVTDCNI